MFRSIITSSIFRNVHPINNHIQKSKNQAVYSIFDKLVNNTQGIDIQTFASRSAIEAHKRKKRRKNKSLLVPKSKAVFPKVINAVPREVRAKENAEKNEKNSEEMKIKITKQQEAEPLRYAMSGLQMNDKVRKLMDLTNASKSEIVKSQKQRAMELFQKRDGDTGSSAVQVIAVTMRIQQLEAHMSTHKKDFGTKRGLDRLRVRRRKLLDYMERKEFDDYRRVVKTLGMPRS